MTNVTELRPDRKPLAQFIRVGMTGHRQLEDLILAGRVTIDRAVVDASVLPRQLDLAGTLLARPCELVLETNVAELSSIGRFKGTVQGAPWARSDRALRRTDFVGIDGRRLVARIAEFGVDSTAVGVRRYIEALTTFQELGLPIVADGVAGLTALASMAFGAAGGVAHGVAEMERFDASQWSKPPKNASGGGRKSRVLISQLDRQLDFGQLQAIANVQNGRRLISCSDGSCCPRGFEDMQRDPKRHYLIQRRHAIETLSRIPETNRARHFLERDMLTAERFARQLSRLRVDPPLREKLTAESVRLEKMTMILGDLYETGSQNDRAASPRVRVNLGLSGNRNSAS